MADDPRLAVNDVAVEARSPGVVRRLALAAVIVAAVVATEYAFRHYVLFWMPVVGSLRVNDMLALAMAYSLLTIAVGALAHADWRQELRLVAFGALCGTLARRHSWRASAALHLVVNTAATGAGLIFAKE